MNVSSSAKSPYLLQTERSNKPKATYGNRFRDALEKEKAENNISESAEEQAVEAIQKSAADEKKYNPNAPTYTVTEEQAEYFREKYGEEYDEKKARDFFLELSENKVISWTDALETLGLNTIVRAYGATECIDTRTNTVSYIANSLNAPEYKKSYLTDTSFESAYVKFERQYYKTVETWQDYVQKQLDFYNYLIESDEIPTDAGGEVPVSKSKEEWNMGFKSRYDTIEKVAGVVDQIFEEVTL